MLKGTTVLSFSSKSQKKPADGSMKNFADRLKNLTSVLKPRQNLATEEQNASYVLESQKHIHNAEDLLADMEEFLASVGKIIRAANKVNTVKRKFDPLHVTAVLSKWKVKKKGNKTLTEYDSLMSRGQVVEEEMKKLIDESLQDCGSLILQSEHVQTRILACIHYNEGQLKVLEPLVESSMKILAEFKGEQAAVQSMIAFYDEVVHLKDRQFVPYVPWSQRIAEPPIEEIPFDRPALERRLKKLNRVTNCIDDVLRAHLPGVNKMKSNMEHCLRSLNALRGLSKKLSYYRSMVSSTTGDREGSFGEVSGNKPLEENVPAPPQSSSDAPPLPPPSSPPATTEPTIESPRLSPRKASSDSVERRSHGSLHARSTSSGRDGSMSSTRERSRSEVYSPERALKEALETAPLALDPECSNGSTTTTTAMTTATTYDHSHCSDCGLMYLMANECAMHLAAAQHFAQEGSVRLQRYFSLREQVGEVVHQLEDVDLDGDHPFHS